MKIEMAPGTVKIKLSRRNLMVLLAKLDGRPAGSLCTIAKEPDGDEPLLIVIAEQDDAHYSTRGYPPGAMHPDTELAIEEALP